MGNYFSGALTKESDSIKVITDVVDNVNVIVSSVEIDQKVETNELESSEVTTSLNEQNFNDLNEQKFNDFNHHHDHVIYKKKLKKKCKKNKKKHLQ
jgi:hypothetical protein